MGDCINEYFSVLQCLSLLNIGKRRHRYALMLMGGISRKVEHGECDAAIIFDLAPDHAELMRQYLAECWPKGLGHNGRSWFARASVQEPLGPKEIQDHGFPGCTI